MAGDGVAAKVQELEERLAKLEDKNNNLTMILMSGEFDKAFAAFIIANGALAMGKEVTMFVTFWGLDAIKKPSFSTAGRGFLEKMVLWMRPKGPNKLATSKMNFAGIGPKLFRYMMKKKKVEQLHNLIEMATEFGLKIIGCQMSMDVMGLKAEDLIDGVEVGGVATMLNSSYKSNSTLFI
ncbi:MAG: DsrE/DsrF/DrsH-like family protein [Nitrospirota bacterium]|nr:MAG: DsrE/DsrF/DrsH-like family protein [Nitrospirota bacterium]